MKTVENVSGDTIVVIPNLSEKNECKDIGKIWKKNCPKCGKEQTYSKRWIWVRAIKENKQCLSCSQRIHHVPLGGWTKNCPSCNRIMQYTSIDHLVYSQKNGCVCRVCSNKNSPRRGGKGRPKDLIDTPVTRCKKRISRINYLKSCFGTQLAPTYNKLACEYFEWVNKWNGWRGQYATNGGEHYIKELGYWVDYYEPSENLIIEWDEPDHYRKGQLLKRDIDRMMEIKQHLQCRFYRYNQKTNELKEW